MNRPSSFSQVILALHPFPFGTGKLCIILTKFPDAIELEDDHERRNRYVRKVTAPIDDDLELGHNLEGTHRLENPQQRSLGWVLAPRISGIDQKLRAFVWQAANFLSSLRQTNFHTIPDHLREASSLVLSES